MWLYWPKWARGLAIPQPKPLLLFVWCPMEMTAQLLWTHGQLETTQSNSKSEITPVISEDVYTALLVLPKKKKKRQKTKTGWRPWLSVALGAVSFWLPAQFLAPLFPSKWERNVVCPHHEQTAAEMRNSPTALHRLTWQAAWHHLVKMDCHLKMGQFCPVLAGLSLEENNWLWNIFNVFSFCFSSGNGVVFCGWQRLVGSVWYLQLGFVWEKWIKDEN